MTELTLNQLATYYDCPFRYKLLFIDKLKKSNNNNKIGEIFKKIIKYHYKDGERNLENTQNYLDKIINNYDYNNEEEAREVYFKLKDKIHSFISHINIENRANIEAEVILQHDFNKELLLKSSIDILINKNKAIIADIFYCNFEFYSNIFRHLFNISEFVFYDIINDKFIYSKKIGSPVFFDKPILEASENIINDSSFEPKVSGLCNTCEYSIICHKYSKDSLYNDFTKRIYKFDISVKTLNSKENLIDLVRSIKEILYDNFNEINDVSVFIFDKSLKKLVIIDGKSNNNDVNEDILYKFYNSSSIDNSDPGIFKKFIIEARNRKLGVILIKTPANIQSDIFFHIFLNYLSNAIYNLNVYNIAIKDGLTKLYNKRYFLTKLEEEIERAISNKRNLSLLMIDIDHFKHYNDNYGHQTGDILLQKTSRIYQDTAKNIGIVCRYGGEEFTIILPQSDSKNSYIFAEKLRKRIEDHDFSTEQFNLKVTISIGLVTFPNDTENIDDLIFKADQALYKAKNTGRNKVCIYWRDVQNTLL